MHGAIQIAGLALMRHPVQLAAMQGGGFRSPQPKRSGSKPAGMRI
jgi:hypothetical protein